MYIVFNSNAWCMESVFKGRTMRWGRRYRPRVTTRRGNGFLVYRSLDCKRFERFVFRLLIVAFVIQKELRLTARLSTETCRQLSWTSSRVTFRTNGKQVIARNGQKKNKIHLQNWEKTELQVFEYLFPKNEQRNMNTLCKGPISRKPEIKKTRVSSHHLLTPHLHSSIRSIMICLIAV